MKSISIVFPVYNEKENLEKLISSWDESLRLQNIDYEFVIVEDGSTDGTKELIKELEKNYPILNLSSEKKRGYTKAVLEGIYSSSGHYILCTDSDNQIKVNSLIENIWVCKITNQAQEHWNSISDSGYFNSLVLNNLKMIDRNNNLNEY